MGQSFLESRRTVWLIGGIAICFFALTNLPWNLDDYDQALQAYTSFEMIKAGHWFFQHTPHGLIAQKPPLVGWASAATFLITRSWNVAWRLPCFLSVVAMAIILFRAARAAYGAAPALSPWARSASTCLACDSRHWCGPICRSGSSFSFPGF